MLLNQAKSITVKKKWKWKLIHLSNNFWWKKTYIYIYIWSLAATNRVLLFVAANLTLMKQCIWRWGFHVSAKRNSTQRHKIDYECMWCPKTFFHPCGSKHPKYIYHQRCSALAAVTVIILLVCFSYWCFGSFWFFSSQLLNVSIICSRFKNSETLFLQLSTFLGSLSRPTSPAKRGRSCRADRRPLAAPTLSHSQYISVKANLWRRVMI